MAVLVLVVFVTLLYVLFLRTDRLRESVLKAAVALFAAIAISTEVLSFFGALTRGGTCAVWIVLTLTSLACLASGLRRGSVQPSRARSPARRTGFQRDEAGFLGVVACVLTVTLALALLYPPNNWDSMTYHMSRVAEWIQHGSVDFYPTSIDRQNYQPPLAEFAILHLQLLSQSDRLANIIQWFSFCVSIIAVTLVAEEFRVSRQQQLFSAVVAATIPMAILQSSSTQNDLVTAAFCSSFAYFLLRFVRAPSLENVLFSSLSMGLALLTKGTAYLYCCAIGLALGTAALVFARLGDRLFVLRRLVLIVVAALLFNVGHFSRTYRLYRYPFAPVVDHANERVSGAVLLSNMVRNGALHLGTPSRRINRIGFETLRRLLGRRSDDVGSTMQTTRFRTPCYSLHEDYAGNLLHFPLAIFALLFLASRARRAESHERTRYWYAGAVLLSVLLYCAVLRWQPWATRLHTPIFVLSAPLMAVVLADLRLPYWWSSVPLTVLLSAYSVPFLVANATRPLAGVEARNPFGNIWRLRSYFANRPELHEDYTTAARILLDEGVEEVGLCLDYDDYEYPLWVLVGREASRGTPRFRHVQVKDVSRVLEEPDGRPAAWVLATKRLDASPIHGRGRQRPELCVPPGYVVVFDSVNVRVWRAGEDVETASRNVPDHWRRSPGGPLLPGREDDAGMGPR